MNTFLAHLCFFFLTGEERKKLFDELTNGACSRYPPALVAEEGKNSRMQSPGQYKKSDGRSLMSKSGDMNCASEKSYLADFSTPSSVVSETSYKTTANSDVSFPSSGYHSSVPLDSGVLTAKLNKLKVDVGKKKNFPILTESTLDSNPNIKSDEAEGVERQLDLDTRIEMLLKGQTNSRVDPVFYKVVRKSFEPVDESAKIDANGLRAPSPPREPPLPPPPPPPPPPEEDPEKPLSRPPSPFLSKEIYLGCHQRALELAQKAREEEQQQTTKFLEKVIKSKLINVLRYRNTGTRPHLLVCLIKVRTIPVMTS
jgi:hypothetical protein